MSKLRERKIRQESFNKVTGSLKSTETIQRCVRCVMPSSIPSIELDEDGVCSACRKFEMLSNDFEKTRLERKKRFENIVEIVRKKGRPYDCVVPLSGGKDSIFVLYVCDKIYNMKCLCITFDNGFLSDQAKKNIENAINSTKADHIFYAANRNLLTRLYKIFLKKTGSFCPVCMRGIEIVSMMAKKMYKVPIVIKGTGFKYDYLSYIPELFQSGDKFFFKNVVRGEPVEKGSEVMLAFSKYWSLKKLLRLMFRIIRLPDPFIPEFVSIFDYLEASYDEIYEAITSKMGWRPGKDQLEHMDCTISTIPSFLHAKKFPELTDATCKNSSLVRLGLMTRKEAMEYETKYIGKVDEPSNLESFLNEIGMDRQEFESSLINWRKIEKFRLSGYEKLVKLYRKIIG